MQAIVGAASGPVPFVEDDGTMAAQPADKGFQ